mmetsp:Transcript_4854/g.7064  ORF Transcript_4854/g.7064 Transcript_4854/m.7064 type:complete len:131 (-) Transcript_4854:92-484(-)
MSSRKRQSDTKMIEQTTPGNALGHSSLLGNINNQKAIGPIKGSRLRVKIKRWHGVARWSWNAGDEVCGICQSSFEGCSPGIKYPGDDCPCVWGKCGHAFHLQCVSTWLSSRSTCPFCRAEWEFKAEAGES